MLSFAVGYHKLIEYATLCYVTSLSVWWYTFIFQQRAMLKRHHILLV